MEITGYGRLHAPVVVALVRSGEPIDPRFDALFPCDLPSYQPVPDAFLRECLDALPEERREKALVGAIARMAFQSNAVALATQLLASRPYPGLARFALERLDKARKPKQELRAIKAVAKPNPAIRAVVDAWEKGQPEIPALSVLSWTKAPKLADLDANARAQIEEAAKLYGEGEARTAEEIFANEDEEGIVPDLIELVRIADASGKHVCDAWLYQGDSGTIFEAGTTKVVAEIIQKGLECEDEQLKAALGDVLDPKKKGGSKTPSKKGASKKASAKKPPEKLGERERRRAASSGFGRSRARSTRSEVGAGEPLSELGAVPRERVRSPARAHDPCERPAHTGAPRAGDPEHGRRLEELELQVRDDLERSAAAVGTGLGGEGHGESLRRLVRPRPHLRHDPGSYTSAWKARRAIFAFLRRSTIRPCAFSSSPRRSSSRAPPRAPQRPSSKSSSLHAWRSGTRVTARAAASWRVTTPRCRSRARRRRAAWTASRSRAIATATATYASPRVPAPPRATAIAASAAPSCAMRMRRCPTSACRPATSSAVYETRIFLVLYGVKNRIRGPHVRRALGSCSTTPEEEAAPCRNGRRALGP